jgi:hypothetical protein
MTKTFNTSLADSQATDVKKISAEEFDFAAYQDHVLDLEERCRQFWQAKSGVLVYRRMRVAEVFSYGCKDKKNSLEWQLGGLKKSLLFQTDIPNFLEPWYGIGTIASAYGLNYQWPKKQAPAMTIGFNSIFEALEFQPKSVENVQIGRQTLEMIEYFLDKSHGKLPVSLTDTQSPLNIVGYLVNSTNLMMDLLTDPDSVRKLLDQIAGLAIEFTQKQLDLLASAVVWPGHGFPSSPYFKGLGMSDDTMLMISGQHYLDVCGPATEKFGNAFGGSAFHSCGNWSNRVPFVQQLRNLKMVDAAFSPETDPDHNPAEPFHALANTDIVINARIVGDIETVTSTVKNLWRPGMKLIVTTYCPSAEEQAKVYEQIHKICQ